MAIKLEDMIKLKITKVFSHHGRKFIVLSDDTFSIYCTSYPKPIRLIIYDGNTKVKPVLRCRGNTEIQA